MAGNNDWQMRKDRPTLRLVEEKNATEESDSSSDDAEQISKPGNTDRKVGQSKAHQRTNSDAF